MTLLVEQPDRIKQVLGSTPVPARSSAKASGPASGASTPSTTGASRPTPPLPLLASLPPPSLSLLPPFSLPTCGRVPPGPRVVVVEAQLSNHIDVVPVSKDEQA